MASPFPNGAAFQLGDTKLWVAKRKKGDGNPVLMFAVGDDTAHAAGELFSATVADDLIRALTDGINSLPHDTRNAMADQIEAEPLPTVGNLLLSGEAL